jgi:hypothetical protein
MRHAAALAVRGKPAACRDLRLFRTLLEILEYSRGQFADKW